MAQPQNPAADQLERITPEFDRLIRDTRLGPRNQRQFHELEERAQRIAAAIVAAFRGSTGDKPSAAPLKVDGNKAWW